MALTDLDGDRVPEALVASRSGREAWAGPFGPGGERRMVALTGGGDVVGLGTDGSLRFRLDLQRPPLAIPGDVDQDGRWEMVLWASWYGLAVLRVE